MEGQNQPQQPKQPPLPNTEECVICFDTLKSGKLDEQYTACHNKFHTSCITMWLYSRPKPKDKEDINRHIICPLCRGDMSELLKLLQAKLRCCVCNQPIGPDRTPSLCDSCKRLFHTNERDKNEVMLQKKNPNLPIRCPLCYVGEISLQNYLPIQQAEIDTDISNIDSEET